MAKEKTKVAVLRVISSREGFRRAGFAFGKEPTDLPLADLAKAQIAALKAESVLVCVETEVEVEVEVKKEEAKK